MSMFNSMVFINGGDSFAISAL